MPIPGNQRIVQPGVSRPRAFPPPLVLRAAGVQAFSGTGVITFGGSATLTGIAPLAATGEIDFGGTVAITIITPVVPPPTTPFVYLWQRSLAFPTPTLVSGVPQSWAASSDTGVVPWGRLRVMVNGTDVTFFRGVPTVVEEYVFAEPYGELSARLRFPQVHMFDALGSGDLSWFVPGAFVEIDRVHPNESFTPPGDIVWEGLLEPVNHKRAEELTNTGLIVDCIGIIHQLGFYRRAPGLSNAAIDIGQLMGFQFDLTARPALRTTPPAPVTTGVQSNYRGNWESALEYITKLSEESLDNTGNQWIVMKQTPKTPVIQQKDLATVAWHMAAGQPGCAVDLHQEYTTVANVIYGEGTDPAGSTWRNMYTDGSFGLGIPFFQPLAYDTRVHPYDPSGTGGLTQNLGRVQPSVIRQEAYQGKGQGVTYAEGLASAVAQYNILKDPGWAGTITLTADPEEGSRMQPPIGKNFGLRYFGGPSGITAHIVGAKVTVGEYDTGQAPICELTVDTKARNLPTLMAVLQRKRDLVQNPVKRLLTGKDSGNVADKTFLWDFVRSGWVPNGGVAYDVNLNPRAGALGFRWSDGTSTVPCPGRVWTFVQLLASQTDIIVSTQITTVGPINSFVVALFDRPPNGMTLPVDPTATGADATIRSSPGYVIHWGNPDQFAGYSPGLQSNGDPVTGALIDQAQWQYNHQNVFNTADPSNSLTTNPSFLWLAIWPIKDSSGANSTGTNVWAHLTRLAVQ